MQKRVHQLERESLNNSQYLRREMIKLNPVPIDINDNELEKLSRNYQNLIFWGQKIILSGISIGISYYLCTKNSYWYHNR